MAKLATDICGVRFPSCLINAAGAHDVTLKELGELGTSDTGAITLKTATIEPREASSEQGWFTDELGSLNAQDWPNLGYQAYAAAVEELRDLGKPVIASVGGLKPGDDEKMIAAYSEAGADLIEINLSGRSLTGRGLLGYDFKTAKQLLARCRKETDKPLGVKLPAYFDDHQFEQMAEVIEGAKIDFLVVINAVGGALIIEPGKARKVIAPNDGFGGLAGPYIKPIALGNVHKWFKLVGNRMPIIGVGGVESGTDAFEHLLAGASAVGIGTAVVNEGPDVFTRIGGELESVLGGHGFGSVAAPRGKLKDLPETEVGL